MANDYTQEEAEAILTRAAGRKSADSVSHRRLLEMAEELGISPDEVEMAVHEVLVEQEEKALRQQFIAERRATILPHLIPYLTVSISLIILNLVIGGHFWAHYPVLGWGFGVLIHLLSVIPTRGQQFEEEFVAWQKERETKAQRKARRASKKAAAKTEAVAVASPPLTHKVKVGEEQSQPLKQQTGR